MPAQLTLAPRDHEVFKRIPIDFLDENVCGGDIARELGVTSGDVMRRIARLQRMGLVQRRYATGHPLTSEIRRLHQ